MKLQIIAVPSRANSLRRVVHSFSMCKSIDQISIHMDHEYNGPWWNVRRALEDVVRQDCPCLIAQDDVKPYPLLIDRHIADLASHLNDSVGMVSLFTPPRKEFDELGSSGFDGVDDNYFMWAVFYLVSPAFAAEVIESDQYLDQQQASYHDEIRFRFAAQRLDRRIVTLCHSFASHDLEVKSVLGTPAAIGSIVRDTRTKASMDHDYRDLKLKRRNTARDYDQLRTD